MSRRSTAFVIAVLAVAVVVIVIFAGRPLRAWWDDDAGNRALLRGQRSDAVASFERGLALEPGWALLHEDLGRALLVTQPARALAQFEQAGCGSVCEAAAGDALVELRRPNEAIEQYVRAKAVGRASDAALALASHGSYEAALAIEFAMLGRLRNDFVDRADLAAVYAAMGKIETAAASNGKDGTARMRAGRASVASFARAHELAPLNEGYLLSYGFAQMRWGSKQAARAAFVRLLSLHPGQTAAQSALRSLQTAPARP